MGVYTEYLDRHMSFDQLSAERKKQLAQISALRDGRDVLVFAADLNKPEAPISIRYADLLPINDQLANLHGNALDLLLETPGGAGEIAEDIVRSLRDKYEDVAVLVPGTAKSAGTLIAMAADEILMEPASALGPIDAQLFWHDRAFSADALIKGLERIKDEVDKTGELNRAYIPILQGISPGDLEHARNAFDFAKVLVTDWLVRYKFKHWTHRRSTGEEVTDDFRRQRAEGIAAQLADHQKWLTHGRSIKISDLRDMHLEIEDYSTNPPLADAVRRYHTLMQMTFASNVYKLFETPTSQIYRSLGPPAATVSPVEADTGVLEFTCPACGEVAKIQANLGETRPLQEGHVPFPEDNRFECPHCDAEHDLSDARRSLEAETGKPVVP